MDFGEMLNYGMIACKLFMLMIIWWMIIELVIDMHMMYWLTW